MDMNRETISIKNAKIIKPFRNFEGVEKRFQGRIVNGAGKRNFSIEIDNDFALELLDKFPVLRINNMDREDKNPYIQIEVNLNEGRYKSCIYVGTSPDRMHKMTDDEVKTLDWADIAKADLVVNFSPYISKVTGEERVGVYVKNLYVILEQDDFADEYNISGDNEPEEIPFD